MADEIDKSAEKQAAPSKIELRLAVQFPARKLSPEAQRALAEAAARRLAQSAPGPKTGEITKEINGPQGPEPTRYGDWERKGIISDF